MKVEEYYFNEIYRKFVTIEADDLTEQLKDSIKVTDSDCYALCTPFVQNDGLLAFAVLSIGRSWEHCRKGIRQKAMLGFFTIDDVTGMECRVAVPDVEMVNKLLYFEAGRADNDEMEELRRNESLDSLRDFCYPDVVRINVRKDNETDRVAYMEYTGTNDPFILGKLLDDEDENLVWTLPYVNEQGEFSLIGVFSAKNLNAEQRSLVHSVIEKSASLSAEYLKS